MDMPAIKVPGKTPVCCVAVDWLIKGANVALKRLAKVAGVFMFA